ncbi:hypothetical protein [Salipiger thiooxidans]|uniref:hypothetical protein n=1 Tax=Salipiger thiooxidans TaxID=282683 RepID=UPI001CD55BE1|nr:hypothetical protein [Salipiger thiooxidans]MCA0851258.1 hypothetical protein [Salipiger thiooxidans]
MVERATEILKAEVHRNLGLLGLRGALSGRRPPDRGLFHRNAEAVEPTADKGDRLSDRRVIHDFELQGIGAPAHIFGTAFSLFKIARADDLPPLGGIENAAP